MTAVLPVIRMMMRAMFAGQQPHKSGRKTLRTKLEKQALAACGRHIACRNSGAQQQCHAKQQTALSLNLSHSLHWQRMKGTGHIIKGTTL